MRLSPNKDDPGYHANAYASRVFFNGAEVRGVFTADEEKRLIVQAVLDGCGRFQLAPCKTKVLTDVRHGDVRIEWLAPDHPALAGREAPNVRAEPPP